MLILFDIDMTLITTGGSGMKAMVEAGRELYGPTFNADGIAFAGRLDPLIFSDLLTRHRVADTPEEHARLRRVYAAKLEQHLARGIARTLPGVMDLLKALEDTPATVGVLTGNFEETGGMKLRAAGIDPQRFTVRVWGDESPHTPARREHLVPVGVSRACAVRGEQLRCEQVVVIGDTPGDVACARAHGCRSLAVATGHYGVEKLAEAGASRVVSDLSDTREVLSWLGL